MARDTGNGDEMLYRVDERFAMCSTFKWVLTAMILSQVDRSEIALDRQVKTGTGENGAANDVAIVWPPGREPILIASYLSGSGASHDALNGAHARIAEAIVRRMG
jgi:beta-lactamase class A